MIKTSNDYSGIFLKGTPTTLGYTGTETTTPYIATTNSGGYLGSLTTEFNSGLTLSGNSTINYQNNMGLSIAVTPSKNMTPRQVHVVVFTIKRDSKTNEINSTKFVKELWIEQKNATSIDLLVAKQLGNDFDPETTIIKVLATVSF